MNETAITGLPNLLPYGGNAVYIQNFIGKAEADAMFKVLESSIRWKHDEVTIFGKHYVTSRKSAWYANENLPYKYAGISRDALPFTSELHYLNNLIAGSAGGLFNGCLLNLYHNGKEGMGWHSDDEQSIAAGSTIASLSFGADRRFAFRHKATKQKVELLLTNGSLLLMKDETQVNWHHALLKSASVVSPRINLTFRLMLIPK